jgi:subtilisin family serine protease
VRKKCVVLALALLFPGLASAEVPNFPNQEFVSGELLVVFNPGMGKGPARGAAKSAKGADERADLHAALGTQFLESVEAVDVHRVKLPPGADEAAVTAAYLASPLVKRVGRNGIVHAFACASVALDDTHYVNGFQPWYSLITCDQAYSDWRGGCITLTSMVTVAVVDTGLFAHSELAGLAVPGYNFVTPGGSTNDDHGHGTFVSGVIAALSDNASGLAGVFFDSAHIRIMPVKVLDNTGSGSDFQVLSGIVYAADHGARIINMSLGGAYNDPAIENAVNYAYNKGLFLAAAVGNSGGPAGYPASYSNVMSVGAQDYSGNKASYSSTGKVDISAPGGEGISSCPCSGSPGGCSTEIWGLCNSSGQYRAAAGTSAATPMVSAAAALLLSQNSSRTNDDLFRILTQSALGAGAGQNPSTGWGRLDVDQALYYAKGPAFIPGVTLKIYNFPNPFNPGRDGMTNFVFSLPQAADVDLRIVDMSGDLVYEKKYGIGETQAGSNKKIWDGKNDLGQVVANGVYIVTVTADKVTARNRVAVLK